jgi:shikimate 5-dehydrogenase
VGKRLLLGLIGANIGRRVAPECVHQAAEAFRLVTGITVEVARMQRTFLSAAVPAMGR